MSLKTAIDLLDAQGVDLAAKLQGCTDAAVAARETLDEAETDSLRGELDHLLDTLPGVVDAGRLLGRMEAAAELLKIVEAGGAEALAATFGWGDAKSGLG